MDSQSKPQPTDVSVPPELPSFDEALRVLRGYPAFHAVIKELRERRESMFPKLLTPDEKIQQQVVGSMTTLSRVAGTAQSNACQLPGAR